jgi:hypothetical protein
MDLKIITKWTYVKLHWSTQICLSYKERYLNTKKKITYKHEDEKFKFKEQLNIYKQYL